MTYDDQLKSDEKPPFWSNPLLYKQGGTTQENTGQDTPAFDSQTTGGEELVVRVEVLDQFIRVLPPRCGEENDLTQRRAVLQEIAQIGTLTRPDGERLSVELDLDMISRG